MPNDYEALYAWMGSSFEDGPFTAADFRETFPSPAPAKVLSDLHRLGYVTSPRRGTYRVVPPTRRIDEFLRRDAGVFGLPDRSALPHAYCESTAISIWTDGGYWTGFTRGFRPLHLRVRRADLPGWRAFFRDAGARSSLAGARETLFGVVHILHPKTRVRSVDHDGVRVVPLSEAYAYAAARPYLYEPVLPPLRARMGRVDG
jgi:hypothetical protein